jgi:hypothetical protein
VLDGIPGETAFLIGRRITLPERRISVRVLVRDHREEQDRRDEQEVLDFIQSSGGC